MTRHAISPLLAISTLEMGLRELANLQYIDFGNVSNIFIYLCEDTITSDGISKLNAGIFLKADIMPVLLQSNIKKDVKILLIRAIHAYQYLYNKRLKATHD